MINGFGPDWEENMAKAFAFASSRPVPKLGPPVGSPPPGKVPCGRCRALIPVEMIRYYSTGICMASDSLCDVCATLVPQHALIVCIGCKAVVARVAPERLKSGFEIEPRRIYHTEACPSCKPGVVRSKILEAELFYQKVKC